MRARTLFAVGAALVAVRGHAQGVFDMGALTNTLSQDAVTHSSVGGHPSGSGHGKGHAAPRPRIPAAALRYRSDSAARKANASHFLAMMKPNDPAQGEKVRHAFDGADVIGQLRQAVRPNGIDPDNLGDVLSLYLVSAWYGSRGSTDSKPKDFQRVAAQMRQALRSIPAVARLSNAQKQQTADTLLLNASFNEIWVNNAKKGQSSLPTVRAAIRQAARASLGVDVAKLRLGANGFY